MTAALVPYHGPVVTQGQTAALVDIAAGHHGQGTDADRLAARAEVIATLLLRGVSYRDIGEAVGISKSQVGREVAKIRTGWEARTAAAYGARIAEEDAKLDWLERQWFDAAGSDAKAAELLIRIMDRRAKLLGLDKPTKIDARLTLDVEAERARGLRLVEAVESAR
jgi:hypothetical protein